MVIVRKIAQILWEKWRWAEGWEIEWGRLRPLPIHRLFLRQKLFLRQTKPQIRFNYRSQVESQSCLFFAKHLHHHRRILIELEVAVSSIPNFSFQNGRLQFSELSDDKVYNGGKNNSFWHMLKEFGFQMPLIQGARMRSEEMALVFPTMFRANNFQTNRVG